MIILNIFLFAIFAILNHSIFNANLLDNQYFKI